MTVYVDNVREYDLDQIKPEALRYGKKWCHMVADTEAELHEMAAKLRLSRTWYQNRSSMPHYDLTPKKAADAMLLGAQSLSTMEMCRRFSTILNPERKA